MQMFLRVILGDLGCSAHITRIGKGYYSCENENFG